VHLLAAMDHADGMVLAQRQADYPFIFKGNQPALRAAARAPYSSTGLWSSRSSRAS
jgi:hypothetical protein